MTSSASITTPLLNLPLPALKKLHADFQRIVGMIELGTERGALAQQISPLRSRVEDQTGDPHYEPLTGATMADWEHLLTPALSDIQQKLSTDLLAYELFLHGNDDNKREQAKAELIETLGEYLFGDVADLARTIDQRDLTPTEQRELASTLARFAGWDDINAFHRQWTRLEHATAAERSTFVQALGDRVEVATRRATYGYDVKTGEFNESTRAALQDRIRDGEGLSDAVREQQQEVREHGKAALYKAATAVKTERTIAGLRLVGLKTLVRGSRHLRVFGYGFGKAVAALGELPAVAADEMTISGRQVRESFGKRRNRRQAEQKDRVVVGKAAVGLALTTAVAVVAGVVVDGIVSSENSIPTPRWTQPDPQAPTPRTNANPRSRNAIRTFNGMTEEQWIERIDGEGSSTQEAAMIVGKVFNGGATDALQNMVASGANSPVAIQNGPYSHKFLLATAGASLENAVESGDELDAKRATWALNNWSSPPRAVEQRVDQVRDELDAGTSRQQWQNDAEQLLKELNAHGLQTTLADATPTRIQHFGLAD